MQIISDREYKLGITISDAATVDQSKVYLKEIADISASELRLASPDLLISGLSIEEQIIDSHVVSVMGSFRAVGIG